MATKVDELIQRIQQLPQSERDHVITSVLKSLRSESAIRSLTDLKAQHPNEWLAVIIPGEENRYDPQRGRLVAHSPDRSHVWQQVEQLSADEEVYVFFSGPIIAKGFGIIFHDTESTPEVATVGS